MDTTTTARGPLMLRPSLDMDIMDMLPMPIPMLTTTTRGLLMLSQDMDMLPMATGMPTMDTTDIPMPTITTRGPLMPSLDMDMPMDTPMPTMDMPTTDTMDTIINLLNIC